MRLTGFTGCGNAFVVEQKLADVPSFEEILETFLLAPGQIKSDPSPESA